MKIAIIGTVGIPGCYGGFETLAENLAYYHFKENIDCELIVYCSRRAYIDRPNTFLSTQLKYSIFNANGLSSIIYDFITCLHALIYKANIVLILGVSGGLFLPIFKFFFNAKIIINIDGIEWKRQKWKKTAQIFLRWSEYVAIKYSDFVIADNIGIENYIKDTYGINSKFISYGGDHAHQPSLSKNENSHIKLPDNYMLSLCRIEPENNVEMILKAFTETKMRIVFIGNWNASQYGINLKKKYSKYKNITLFEPIYEQYLLNIIRLNAAGYIHGHSAGGTNPSLVEMMFYNVPIFVFDCIYNRYTTENMAIYFNSSHELANLISSISAQNKLDVIKNMNRVAIRNYRWEIICKKYFNLFINNDINI